MEKYKVLKLKMTLYGIIQSHHALWEYLTAKLEACEMAQSKLDPSLFVVDKVIWIVDVDDLVLWAKDKQDIHNLAIKLLEDGVDLDKYYDSAGVLGVTLKPN